jgi:hypothetical protein
VPRESTRQGLVGGGSPEKLGSVEVRSSGDAMGLRDGGSSDLLLQRHRPKRGVRRGRNWKKNRPKTALTGRGAWWRWRHQFWHGNDGPVARVDRWSARGVKEVARRFGWKE